MLKTLSKNSKNQSRKLMLVGSVLALAMSCGSENNENNNPASGFEGGAYTVTVQDVEDGCFDGAMNAIVLPDGTARNLPQPVTLPAHSALPGSIDITFNAPFQNVTGVAVEAVGDNGVKTSGTGFTQNGVDITADDTVCNADMQGTFSLTSSGEGELTGTGTLTITAATGADCPAFTNNPPCTVKSNIRAVKN